MTISQDRATTVALPAEGETGIIDIGPLTLESGAVLDDVSIAVQRRREGAPRTEISGKPRFCRAARDRASVKFSS